MDGKISAITGFQSKGLDFNSLNTLLKGTLAGEDRVIEFIQTSLRSAKDLYKQGGHVTMTYADRIYRMEYDNKRILVVPKELINAQDFSNVLLDSVPSQNASLAEGLRYLAGVHKKRDYNRMTTKNVGSKYKSYLDTAVRNFIKGCLTNPPGYNLTAFDNYSDLIEFVKNYNPKYKISKSSLSHLKNRKLVVKGIPRNAETLAFVEYIKLKFPNFDEKGFFKS